jgi:hypothetical protein
MRELAACLPACLPAAPFFLLNALHFLYILQIEDEERG